MKPINSVPEKEEKDLVAEARRVAVELGQERKSALCKAVTHKAVEAKAEEMIRSLCREVERLNDELEREAQIDEILHCDKCDLCEDHH